MSKNDNFWDNPFGGLFDFNGDGKEDWAEQWIAYKMFQEITKEDEEDSVYSSSNHHSSYSSKDYSWREYVEVDYLLGIFPEDYETEEEYLEAFNEAKYAWREDCEDGYEYGIDPEDYETEDEYNDALDEAREEAEENEYCFNEPLFVVLSEPAGKDDSDDFETIKESDFPNKRRYNAAYTLANEFIAYVDKKCEERKKSCCRFIIENADEIIAANYCTHDYGFLYAQAIKDNFKLPVSLPDEDECPEYDIVEIISKISKKDVDLALKVWAWLIEEFLPYVQYTTWGEKELTFDLIDNLGDLPDKFVKALAHYLNDNPDFCNTIMSAHEKVAAYLSDLICVCIQEELFDLAIRLFEFGLNQANGKWKEINKFIRTTIVSAENYSELETMEFIQLSILPIVKSIDIGMVQDEIEDWEKEIAEYIDYVEGDCEQYAFTRKNAWRTKVPDGSEYDMDPRWYDSEEEYLAELNEQKYGWREWNRDMDTLGLNVDDFETQEEFLEAFEARLEENRQKQREQRKKDNLQIKKQREQKLCEEKQKYIEDDTVYTLCGVAFPHSSQPYHYRTEDMTIVVGDKVLVPVGDKETVGKVVSVGQYMRISAPYPIDKIKFIIEKVDEDSGL